MSDLTELEQYALAVTLQRVAPEHADLADSLSFGRQLAGVPPSAPDYEARLRVALRAAGRPAREEIAADRAAEAARQAAEAERQARAAAGLRNDPRHQWTEQDVRDASLEELNGAYARGQLTGQMGAAAPPRPAKRQAPQRPPAPSAQENARWNTMLPWQAQRARAAWMAANMPEPAPAAPPSYPHLPDGRRLTNEQLAARASRRARLSADYAGVITAEDLAVAQPSVVESWMNAGKLEHLGVPPQHRHGVRT